MGQLTKCTFLTGALMITSSFSLLWSENKKEETCPGNFFVQGDFLYWKTQLNGLEFATDISKTTGTDTQVSPTLDVITSRSRERFPRPHFEARPGFRIAAGYNFKDCQWALGSDWTHVKGHAHISHGPTKGHVNLDYNVVDLLVTGPQFDLGSSFQWRPFAGARFAWIHQKIKARSTFSSIQMRPSSNQNLIQTNNNRLINNSADFRGIGPEVGVHTSWVLPKGFRVYADADGCLPYTHYDAKLRNSFNETVLLSFVSDPTETDLISSKDKGSATANTCQIVLDLAFGVSWQRYVCLCQHSVGCIFKLGWEHSQWFDFNSLGSQGDLFLDGLTASAQIQF